MIQIRHLHLPRGRRSLATLVLRYYLFRCLTTCTFRLTACQHSFIRILLQSWQASNRSVLTLFSVPNPTFTVLIVFLINRLAVRIEVLLPQYTSLVLHWPLATVNRALALKALVSSLMLFALPTLRKWFFEPRMSTLQVDLLITQVSLFTKRSVSSAWPFQRRRYFLFWRCASIRVALVWLIPSLRTEPLPYRLARRSRSSTCALASSIPFLQ